MPNSNKWVSGTIPVYYWNDGTKLRLTDKTAMPVGTIVLGIYENIDLIPQDIIDEVVAHNNDDIKLIQYKSGFKTKITDRPKTGKIQAFSVKEPLAKDVSNNSPTHGIFDGVKDKPVPSITIKAFDGRTQWVSPSNYIPYAGYTYNDSYWWRAEHDMGVDPYQLFYYRVIDGGAITGAITGFYKYNLIEVRENLEYRTQIGGGGDILQLCTVGTYSCNGFNYGHPPEADGRYLTTYVGMGTYEQIVEGKFEEIFDTVISETNNPNTYNMQLGSNWLQHIDVGVRLSDDEYSVLTPSDPLKKDYTYTPLVEPPGTYGWWHGVDYLIDVTHPEYKIDPLPPTNHRTIGDWFSAYRPYLVGINQPFVSNRDEAVHLSFTDDWHMFQDFNTTNKEDFCVTRTKFDYNSHADLIIPRKTSPTIEVILIPKKWHYIVWMYGLFNYVTEFTPKWLCTSYDGTAPLYYGSTFFDPGVLDIKNIRMETPPTSNLYIYINPASRWAQPFDYRRWSVVSTPNGQTFGPVYTDPALEDMIKASTSFWYRLCADVDGYTPQNRDNNYAHPTPGFSAWAMPTKANQLVAIIRLISNGVADYRYVYSKKDSTEDPILRAYAHTNASFYGLSDACVTKTPETFLAEFGDTPEYEPPIGSEVVENEIPAYWVSLYESIAAQYNAIKY